MNTIASARAWRDSVLDALARLAGRRKNDVIERQTILADELGRIIAETHSAGATPDQTLSRVLQDLRDEGLLEFLGGGRYRLLNRPVDVETSDLSDQELDEAISRRLLRIGAVSTGDAVAETRCRRGQERIRALTLESYRSQCALCDVSDPSLLIASHIQPWAVAPDARGDLSNTICLCRFHDTLFELGYWSLDDAGVILIRANIVSATVRFLLPSDLVFRRPAGHPPAPSHLRVHRQMHGFESGSAGA